MGGCEIEEKAISLPTDPTASSFLKMNKFKSVMNNLSSKEKIIYLKAKAVYVVNSMQ